MVRDAAVTTAGYQGTTAPDQWFGGPTLSTSAGNMVLRDAAGLVVDSLNYGGIVDPWAAEGYQAASGAAASGNFVAIPNTGRGGRGGPAPGTSNRSAGRFPDGTDTADNHNDFLLQTVITLAADSAAGANNIKVASVANFAAGKTVIIDSGANRETAVIATVGTPGGTTVGTATDVGATVIPVANTAGFSAGQTISIDSETNLETAVVASVSGRGSRGGGRGGPGGGSITIAAALTMAHAGGAQVSGTGIILTTALTKAHASGTQIADYVPTPGAANLYSRRTR